MKSHDIIQRLAELQVQMHVEGTRLRYRTPQGTVTGEIRAAIAKNRVAIIKELEPTAFQSSALQRCTVCDPADWIDYPAANGRIRTICRVCRKFVEYLP